MNAPLLSDLSFSQAAGELACLQEGAQCVDVQHADAGLMAIHARDDVSAVRAWLARHADSPATWSAYRKEAERLLLWCRLERGLRFGELKHEDCLAYASFLADPQPVDRWCVGRGARPPRSHPAWRPFVGPLSSSSQRQALTILRGLFNWLVQAGYCPRNPWALGMPKRHRLPADQTRLTRHFSLPQWQALMTTLAGWPEDSLLARRHKARARWVLMLLYITGMRISEACAARSQDVLEERASDGTCRRWLRIDGKGGHIREVPLAEPLWQAWVRYRAESRFPPVALGGQQPLVASLDSPDQPLARSALHQWLKQVLSRVALEWESSRDERATWGPMLRRASAHWIRHTTGSHLAESLDLVQVRDHLGHRSIATTSRYLHTEHRARHDATSAVQAAWWLDETQSVR